MHWEDRVSAEQYAKIEAALNEFRDGKQGRQMEHVLYDKLSNAGLTPEEADEMVALEVESCG